MFPEELKMPAPRTISPNSFLLPPAPAFHVRKTIVFIPLTIALVFLAIAFLLLTKDQRTYFLYFGAVCLLLYVQYIALLNWKKKIKRRQAIDFFENGIEGIAQIKNVTVITNKSENMVQRLSFTFVYKVAGGQSYGAEGIFSSGKGRTDLRNGDHLPLLYDPRQPEQFCLFLTPEKFARGKALVQAN